MARKQHTSKSRSRYAFNERVDYLVFAYKTENLSLDERAYKAPQGSGVWVLVRNNRTRQPLVIKAKSPWDAAWRAKYSPNRAERVPLWAQRYKLNFRRK